MTWRAFCGRAPLILLAATRQANRDKLSTIADANHREDIAQQHAELLRQNTATKFNQAAC